MNELAHNIEYILLSRNCVIVPSLGEFRTMSTPARWIESESLFLPPVRNVHFNSSILSDPEEIFLQSLAEVYDLTPEESLKRCEEMVAEFHKALVTEGTVDFGSIGVFTLEDDAEITMASCECGVITPSYYGLDALHMRKLERTELKPKQEEQPYITIEDKADGNEPTSESVTENIATRQIDKNEEVENTKELTSEDVVIISHNENNEESISDNQTTTTYYPPTTRPDEKHVTIKIRRSVVNYAMAIAATIALFFIFKPTTIENNFANQSAQANVFLHPNMIQMADESEDFYPENIDTEELDSFDAVLVDITQEALNEGFDFSNVDNQIINEEETPSTPSTATAAEQPVKVEQPVKPTAVENTATQSNGNYGIVLASSISRSNAEKFVERLNKENINASIYEKGSMRRVIIGGFNTQAEAYEFLRPFKMNHSDLSSAWVSKL